MSPRRLAPLVVLPLLAAAGPIAAAEEEATAEHKVDELVQKAGITAEGPGVGVLVVTKHGVQVMKAYGLANVEKHTPLTTSTTFELASVSKQMAGSAVLLLVQREKGKVE